MGQSKAGGADHPLFFLIKNGGFGIKDLNQKCTVMPNTNIGDIFIKGPDFEFHDLTPEQERLQKIRMLKSEYHASKSHTEKHEAKVKMLGIMTFCESFLFKIEEQQRLEKQKKWWAENSHLIHNIRTYLLPG